MPPMPNTEAPSVLPAFDAGPELGLISRSHVDDRAIGMLSEVIDHLQDTDENSWWAGPTYRSPCGDRHCALSHIEARWGVEAMELFECVWSTSYVIGSVNDGGNPDYPQPTAKARSLAYLDALRRGDELDNGTSMERDSRYFLSNDAAGAPLDLPAAMEKAAQLGCRQERTATAIGGALEQWSAGNPSGAQERTRGVGLSDDQAFEIMYAALRASKGAS